MNNKVLLIIAVALIGLGIMKPDWNWPVVSIDTPVVIERELKPLKPNDKEVLELCNQVIEVLKNGDGNVKLDAPRLRDFYLDLATIYQLDEKEGIIKTTEDIRNANSMAGHMLRMDLNKKYEGYNAACSAVVASQIGTKNIVLDKEIRTKAVQAFLYLAWACDGAK